MSIRLLFCLDPEAVQRAITPQTKAIIAVNLFGHAAPLGELKSIARRHGLWLIEDNAQAPLARECGRYAGTIGDIGVFSLNYHKHIHTGEAGEGGMCVTDDDDLALRLKAIRNHAENVVEPLDIDDITNLLGFNYRTTELSAVVRHLDELGNLRTICIDRRRWDRAFGTIQKVPGVARQK